jgi:hypothetical protein
VSESPRDPVDPGPEELDEDRRTGEEPDPFGRPPRHPDKKEPVKP